MTEDGSAPLAGLRVLEISAYVQGPVAGLILASLGADVVKVEQVGRSDVMRNLASMHGVEFDERGKQWVYSTLNRGKRSVALDITSTRGKELLRSLIGESDVFVTNLRAGELTKLGVNYEVVHELNPSLVYGQGGGFGFAGDMAGNACQDTSAMAYAGFMDTTSPNDEPNYPSGALGDVLSGSNLAAAILAGLARRGITGTGSLARTSQLQSLLWLQLLPVGMAASLGQRMEKFSRSESNPLYSVHQTRDGWISVAAINQRHWDNLAEVLGRSDLLEDERFTKILSAEQHSRELFDELAPVIRTRTTSEWWHVFREAGVWSAPVNRIEDIPDDVQVRANDFVVDFPDGFTGVPLPFHVDGWHDPGTVAAEYGQHTDAVLTELGLTPEEIMELRVDGTVW